MVYRLGIDLGGTNIAAAVVDENYHILGTSRLKTMAPRSAEAIADDMALAARQAVENSGLTMKDIFEVGVGSPGSVNPKTGIIATSNNLRFIDVPLKEMMENRLLLKVSIGNDANAAAYGELIAGAGKGVDNFIAVTLGTGVGGGVVVNGKMLTGFNAAAGEVGHMVIEIDGQSCTCGRKGCFEAYASATALIRQTRAAMSSDKSTSMWDLVGGDINKISGRTAFDGMRAGDKLAKAVVDRYIQYISCGVANLVNIFQPEIICIGGGISKERETLVDPIREHLKKENFAARIAQKTQIVPAVLGNDAGIIGAAYIGGSC